MESDENVSRYTGVPSKEMLLKLSDDCKTLPCDQLLAGQGHP
jgi:hypothetical protein